MVAERRRYVNSLPDEDDGALAVVPHDLAALVGGPARLAQLLDRQAVFYGLEEAERNDPDNRMALLRAMTLSLQYGFLPGQHLHLIGFKKAEGGRGQPRTYRTVYAVVVGVHACLASFEAWKQTTRKQAWVRTEELSAEEVRQVTAERYPNVRYDPQDRGAFAQLVDADEAKLCRELGWTYDPPKFYGFWRRNASGYRDERGQMVYTADTIPAQRSPMDVALRRAVKACLMGRVPLMPIGPASMTQRVAMLEATVAPDLPPDPRDSALLAGTDDRVIVEDDGEILWAAPSPGRGRA